MYGSSSAVADRLVVYAYASDPVLQTGLHALLASDERLTLLDGPHLAAADVAVVAADAIDDALLRVVRAIRTGDVCPPVLALVGSVDTNGIERIVAAGANRVLRRGDVSSQSFAIALAETAHDREPVMPAVPLAVLPVSSRPALSARDLHVLRLIADGIETLEIARELDVSERTVKNIVHRITLRLHARNRSHAVAAGIRAGLI
jgi:DNA-binding NarL/FixJ family response regulator